MCVQSARIGVSWGGFSLRLPEHSVSDLLRIVIRRTHLAYWIHHLMFTGIVETVGAVTELRDLGGDMRLTVRAPALNWSQVELGDSIATNGICLTVVEKQVDGFCADVSRETLGLTTLGDWRPGTQVNLEQALTPQSRLGGHMVSGHVDGLGEVISRQGDARSERLRIRAPDALAKYIAQKGSITVDGTSLTVNGVAGAVFDLNIVPHTLRHTVIQ